MENYFIKISKKRFIILSLFIPFFYTFLLTLLSTFIKIGAMHRKNLYANDSIYSIFLKKAILAPFIETLFFQAVIIEVIFQTKMKNKEKIAILLSGFFFGGAHFFNTYNFAYTILAVIAGMLFAAIYVFARKRKDINPFLIIFFSHALINFVGFIINDVFFKT